MYSDLCSIFRENEITSSNKMSHSIDLAEKMLVRFDESTSNVHDFIDNCDSAMKLVKSDSKNILFAIIQSKITDNAKAMIRNRNFDTWEDLKVRLLEIFAEKKTIEQRQFEFTSYEQKPGENVISYANKIEITH